MKLFANEQQKSYENTKICYIYKEKFEYKYTKDKNYQKLRGRCYYTDKQRDAAISICNLKYSFSKINSIVFLHGSNYDYHFIIKKLAEGFEGQFTCLAENPEK